MDVTLLHRTITKNLVPLVEKPLTKVVYRCLQGDIPADLHDPAFYIGGEVALWFGDGAPVFVTWDENAGWNNHFSVKVASETAFLPDTLVPLDASSTPLWKPQVGRTLIGCSVLGWDETPHVISFRFDTGTVLVGNGYMGKAFGDGDDIFARSDSQVPEMKDAQLLWGSGQWGAGRTVNRHGA